MRIIMLCVTLALMGCAAIAGSTLRACTMQASESACFASYEATIEMSEGLSSSQRQAVRDGAALWEAATHGTVSFDVYVSPQTNGIAVVSVPGNATDAMLAYTKGRVITLEDEAAPDGVTWAGIVAHELGHSMGLKHSSDPQALMAASVHTCMVVTRGDIDALEQALP